MSRRKETGIFLENYEKGLGWLAENYLTHYNGEAGVGESTTGHMQHPPSPQRMARTVPGARLIFILRNPIDRIFSHYRFHLQSGELRSETEFSDLIRRTDSEWRRIHLDNGLYYKHLARYAQHFDRDQMLILFHCDLKDDAVSVAQQTYTFLNVDPAFVPEVSHRHNSGGLPRQETLYRTLQSIWQPLRERVGVDVLDATQSVRDTIRSWMTTSSGDLSMSTSDRAYLQALYDAPNRRLENWLGVDLSHWT